MDAGTRGELYKNYLMYTMSGGARHLPPPPASARRLCPLPLPCSFSLRCAAACKRQQPWQPGKCCTLLAGCALTRTPEQAQGHAR
jgi:hypothetical protein